MKGRSGAAGADTKELDAVDEDRVGDTRRISKKQRLTVSLSDHSIDAFNELKDATDADTDSEVVRNALRLHLALLRAYQSGSELLLRKGDADQLVRVDLFVPTA